jgi:hypothetical protein
MARSQRNIGLFIAISILLLAAALLAAGVVGALYLTKDTIKNASDSEQTPDPPPPSDVVPTAPGPDNTITTAPPRPPPEMPSPPKPEPEPTSDRPRQKERDKEPR